MEKGNVFECPPPLHWESPEVNCSPPADQPPPCFLSLNRERLMGQSLQLELALKSIVSSPSNGRPPPADGVVVRELIGRLGSICNAGEFSPQYMGVGSNSAAASGYSTPLNSPPELNLPMVVRRHAGGLPSFEGNPLLRPTHLSAFAVAPDPGLAERATTFSGYGGRNYGGLGAQFNLPETSNLTAGGSQMPLQRGPQLEADTRPNLTLRPSRSLMMSNGAESGGARVESPAIEQFINGTESGLRGGSESNSKKRKALPNSKGKNIPPPSSAGDPPAVPELSVEESESYAKRSKSGDSSGVGNDSVKLQAEQQSNASSGDSGLKQGKEKNSKPPEPPKQDYIHVRARRGQATDSHSLAERVRREKISQKMKFLQDLVPGCSKVTGKALMLDEIINYVQSLHRQVEFLSMKLATVNPRSDFSVDSLLQKDMHQQHGSLPHSLYPLEVSASAFQYTPQQHQQGISLQNIVTHGLDSQCSLPPMDTADATLCRTPIDDGFANASSQLGTLWEDDLQSVVEMGRGQIPETAFSSQSLHGSVLTAHMKTEL